MSCKGEPIEFKDLRTEDQKKMMSLLSGILMGGMKVGATPFPGYLSAPPDHGQMAAMATMMQHGGYGPYTYGPVPISGQPAMGQPMPFVGGSMPGGGGTGAGRARPAFPGSAPSQRPWYVPPERRKLR